jgi:hypothetical protein
MCAKPNACAENTDYCCESSCTKDKLAKNAPKHGGKRLCTDPSGCTTLQGMACEERDASKVWCQSDDEATQHEWWETVLKKLDFHVDVGAKCKLIAVRGIKLGAPKSHKVVAQKALDESIRLLYEEGGAKKAWTLPAATHPYDTGTTTAWGGIAMVKGDFQYDLRFGERDHADWKGSGFDVPELKFEGQTHVPAYRQQDKDGCYTKPEEQIETTASEILIHPGYCTDKTGSEKFGSIGCQTVDCCDLPEAEQAKYKCNRPTKEWWADFSKLLRQPECNGNCESPCKYIVINIWTLIEAVDKLYNDAPELVKKCGGDPGGRMVEPFPEEGGGMLFFKSGKLGGDAQPQAEGTKALAGALVAAAWLW